jgi:hypothetical protein
LGLNLINVGLLSCGIENNVIKKELVGILRILPFQGDRFARIKLGKHVSSIEELFQNENVGAIEQSNGNGLNPFVTDPVAIGRVPFEVVGFPKFVEKVETLDVHGAEPGCLIYLSSASR